MTQGQSNQEYIAQRDAQEAADAHRSRRETLTLLGLAGVFGLLGYGIGVYFEWPQPLGAAVLGIAVGVGIASALPR